MPPVLERLKSALVTGLLIVLPAWLAVLLLVKMLVQLGVFVKPIAGHLPSGVDHPRVIAVVVFILLCLLVGMLFHTAIGKAMGRVLGDNVFNRVPGYQPLRAIARQFHHLDATEGFQPAMIEVEDGCLAPAFLIERHDGGRCTIFMPSVPTPMAGNLFIMPEERVHIVEVPVTTMMKCISKWGTGSAEILRAMPRGSAEP